MQTSSRLLPGRFVMRPYGSGRQARAFLEGYSQGSAATVGAVVVTDLRTGLACEGLDRAEVRCDSAWMDTGR